MWPVSLSQNGAQMRNINIPWPKSNLFWIWSEYINRQIWGHPCLVFSRKWPEIANLACFIKSKWGKSTDDYQNLISFQGGQDTSAWRISGNSTNQLYLWRHHKDKLKRYNWKKKIDKNTKLQFWPNPVRMLIKQVDLLNHLDGSSQKIKSCCNNNSNEAMNQLLTFHITWTQDRVKVANSKKLPKFKFWKFSRNLMHNTPSEVCW